MESGYHIADLSTGDWHQWDKLVQSSPQGTIFCTSTWAQVAEEALGLTFRIHGVYQGDHLAAGCMVRTQRRYGISMAGPTPLVPYQGMLLLPRQSRFTSRREDHVHALTDQVLQRLAALYSYVCLVHHPSLSDMRPYQWAGWSAIERYTYLLDLESNLWEQVEPGTRRYIRRAQDHGIEIRRSEDVEAAANLVALSYSRQGARPPFSSEGLIRLYRALSSRGLARLYLAYHPDRTPVAALAVVESFDTAYPWIQGTDPDRTATGATPLLIWHVFKDLSTSFKQLDFAGANIASIAHFKAAFGGRLVSYHVTEHFRSLWIRTLLNLHRRRFTRK